MSIFFPERSLAFVPSSHTTLKTKMSCFCRSQKYHAFDGHDNGDGCDDYRGDDCDEGDYGDDNSDKPYIFLMFSVTKSAVTIASKIFYEW